MTNTTEDELVGVDTLSEVIAQYGVAGQRWGFRRATTRGSTPPSKRSKGDADGDGKPDKPAKRSAKPNEEAGPPKRKLSDVSDTELRDRINRLRMEKEFQQLTTPAKTESLVREALKSAGVTILKNVVTTTGTNYLNKAAGVGLNKALPEAYRVVAQQPKDKKKD